MIHSVRIHRPRPDIRVAPPADQRTREEMAAVDENVARLVALIDAGDPRLDLTRPDPEEVGPGVSWREAVPCGACGKMFSKTAAHHRFCSNRCKRRAYKARDRRRWSAQNTAAKRRHRVKARKAEESK